MLTVTKKFTFCYGHHLPNHPGKCKNVHGHNSEVEVEVRLNEGWNLDAKNKNGMIVDFSDLKFWINTVIEKLDHQYLNDVFEKTTINVLPPTAENIVLYIKHSLTEVIPTESGIIIVRIRISETPTSWAEWKADG